ncbi:CotH kinase family protein [Paenibacillus sp. YAF4_2]|uniref:CotH kinase family protein n=1 Tax=Paenibacillus sp. YAF4_2 TaxID=3233085 RepID=UPI003F99C90A
MKAKLVLTLFSIILVIGLTACGSKPEASNDGGTTADKAATPKEEQFLDETVFPKDKVVDVKITIDKDEFQDIIDNASAEEYHTASVDYNGEHYDNVGIRAKGNLSLRSVVQMDDSDRYSFKLSFDEYVNQTLGGITKINLNNNYSDATYMREFLTYELAEQMGLPTPKFSFVNVYVNDKLWGFYLAVEQISDEYLERNFDNAYGALYKGVMGTGSDLLWIDDKLDSYPGLTQKSKSSNNDILIDMLDELNNGTDLEKYINVDDALGYIALNTATVNMDSYIGGNKQNYYLYEDDGVFSILPWDYNMAFGGMGGGNSSSLLIDEPTQSAVADRPLVAKLLAVDEYKEKYHEMLQKMIDGYLSDEKFTARVNELNTMISSYVKADPSSFYTYEQYEAGVRSLISTNASTVSNISQQLDGTIASSGDGSGSGGGFGGGGGGGFGGGGGGGFGGMQGGGRQQGAAPAADDAAQGANGAGAQQQGAAQGGADMGEPPGGFQGDDKGQPPDGFQGGGMGQGGGGGMRGGGFGGMGGMGTTTNQQDNSGEAIKAGIAILVMLLARLFIKYFNRRRL